MCLAEEILSTWDGPLYIDLIYNLESKERDVYLKTGAAYSYYSLHLPGAWAVNGFILAVLLPVSLANQYMVKVTLCCGTFSLEAKAIKLEYSAIPKSAS
jgi:hypothetical protein